MDKDQARFYRPKVYNLRGSVLKKKNISKHSGTQLYPSYIASRDGRTELQGQPRKELARYYQENKPLMQRN
jgi:hypothetical protein